MPAVDPVDRSLSCSIAANTRWALVTDATAATEPARRAFEDTFVDQVDPDRKLRPEERARRVARLRKAYYQKLALKSAQARRARSGGGTAG